MNVQRLNIVLEALRCGSLNKAAEELGYTQSGLTYAINSLESELGVPVVIRDAYGIRLSPEGQVLLPLMKDMIKCEEKILEKAGELLKQKGNVLNIAAYPSMSTSVLPGILSEFNKAWPDIKVNVNVCSRDVMVQNMQEGLCDFGFGGEIYLPSCEWLPLFDEPEYAVLPVDFPTDGMTEFPMEEFSRHPFALPVYWAEEQQIVDQIEEYKIEPQFVVTAFDNAPIIAMVEQGLALTVMPKLTMVPGAKVKTLPVTPACVRKLGVNYRRGFVEGTAAARFLKCLAKWHYEE